MWRFGRCVLWAFAQPVLRGQPVLQGQLLRLELLLHICANVLLQLQLHVLLRLAPPLCHRIHLSLRGGPTQRQLLTVCGMRHAARLRIARRAPGKAREVDIVRTVRHHSFHFA